MRNTIFTLAMLIAVSVSSNAQKGLEVGAFVGIPVADGGDFATLSLGVDVAYFFDIGDKVSVGPTTGFVHSFGEDRIYYDYSGSYTNNGRWNMKHANPNPG